MANKDFKVKNGLVVGQDLNVSGVIKLNDTTVIDSSGKYTGVDSDILSYLSTNNYATQAYVDSTITSIIDSAYIQARQVDLVRDSAFITGVIDAAYIQANQVDIFRNSAFVTDIVDAAYIQARDRIRDSNFVTDIIDSAYINSKVIIPDAGVDSAAIIGIIDSAYVQARSPAINSIGDISDVDTTTNAPANGQALIWDSANGVWSPGNVATSGVDSAAITNLIDSAYINSRVTSSGGSGTVDSAQTIALITDTIDSAYIQARQIIGGSGTVDSAIITAIVEQEFTAQDRINQTNFKFVADSNQSVFTGLDVNNNTLLIDSNLVTVSVNGVILINGEDYTTTSSSITLQYNANFGDEIYVNTLTSKANISINSYGFSGLDNYIFIADSGQTVFTGYDRDSNLLSLTEGLFSVAVNGIRLLPSDYSSTETTLTLNDATLAQDEVLVTQYGFTSALPISALSTFYYTADSGQTVFTGADNNGNTLSYKAGSIQAYLNGIYLIPTVDYTATNGTSFTLTSAAESNAELVINSIVTAYTQGSSGGSGTVDSAQTIALITDTVDSAYINSRVNLAASWTEVTDSSSVLSNSRLIVNTSVKPITLTFPASPTLGDEIKVIDGSGNAYTNNITIDLNGNKINGISDDLLIDYNRASVTLLYYNSTQGWIVSEK